MSVTVNELTREVTKQVKVREVVGRTFTLTMSEQDAALVFYLVGASTYGTEVFHDLLPYFGSVDALRHTRTGKGEIDLARITEQALDKLSNKVSE